MFRLSCARVPVLEVRGETMESESDDGISVNLKEGMR